MKCRDWQVMSATNEGIKIPLVSQVELFAMCVLFLRLMNINRNRDIYHLRLNMLQLLTSGGVITCDTLQVLELR